MKATAIIVVYNRSISESPSFQSAVSRPDVRTIVVDNSTDPKFRNQEEAEKAGAWFVSMHGNAGLSRAYNAALDKISREKTDWVVILDDDTKVPEEYWEELKNTEPDSICLPVVRTNYDQLISPAEMKHDLPRPAASVEEIEDPTGINSGMAIPFSVAKEYRYDERLFLDNVDHKFIRDMKQKGIPIRCMTSKLIQSFSAESTDREALLNRFRMQKRDTYIYYEKHRWKAWYMLGKRKLSLAIQFRDPGILFRV